MDENADDRKINIESSKLLTEFGAIVDAAIERGVREALLQHKRANNPVAVWRDDKIVLIKLDDTKS